MPISESTQLNAIYGTGVLLGLSATGFLIVPRIGKQNTIRLGCLSVAVCFGLIIASGFTGNPILFKSALLLFGLASGITTYRWLRPRREARSPNTRPRWARRPSHDSRASRSNGPSASSSGRFLPRIMARTTQAMTNGRQRTNPMTATIFWMMLMWPQSICSQDRG